MQKEIRKLERVSSDVRRPLSSVLPLPTNVCHIQRGKVLRPKTASSLGKLYSPSTTHSLRGLVRKTDNCFYSMTSMIFCVTSLFFVGQQRSAPSTTVVWTVTITGSTNASKRSRLLLGANSSLTSRNVAQKSSPKTTTKPQLKRYKPKN